jgi:aminopeptidase N
MPLATFHLDASGLAVDAVIVNGRAAMWAQDGDELVVTPERAIEGNGKIRSAITYRTLTAEPGGPTGWFSTSTDAHVVNSPDGAHHWFPSNDDVSERAKYAIRVTVPNDLTVVANGKLVGKDTQGPNTTWSYRANEPMAPNAVEVAVGPYAMADADGPNGLSLREADVKRGPVPPGSLLEVTRSMAQFFADRFGPYPLESYTLVVDNQPIASSLTGSTIAVVSREGASEGELARLLAKQWFGYSVTPAEWSESWLAEGFATYASWMWQAGDDPAGLDAIAAQYRPLVSQARAFGLTTQSPDAATVIGPLTQEGGAMALHALRHKVGDTAFFAIVRRWLKDHKGSSGDTVSFAKTVSDETGTDLTVFLRVWLESVELPPFP